MRTGVIGDHDSERQKPSNREIFSRSERYEQTYGNRTGAGGAGDAQEDGLGRAERNMGRAQRRRESLCREGGRYARRHPRSARRASIGDSGRDANLCTIRTLRHRER